MSRPRTGNLQLRRGVWHAQVTTDERDAAGRAVRSWLTLDTDDRPTAERRLARYLAEQAAGRTPAESAAAASAPDTVSAYALSIGARLSPGDRANLRLHVLPVLGAQAVAAVTAANVKSLRDAVSATRARRHDGTRGAGGGAKVLASTLRRGTAGKVLGALRRLLSLAVEDGLVEQNVAAGVVLPRQRGAERERRKPRCILTDEEITRYLSCGSVDLELRVLSLVARTEGGMRTGDLHAWTWAHIDPGCASCTVPRAKTATPEVLDVPEVLRPHLLAWWERAGCPTSGPVFPTRKGKRAGEARRPKTSHAKRLRRDLARAGVFRLPPVEVAATAPGTRTDLGRAASGTRLVPDPRDPLYYETPVSLPVDFHSFRRAYNTGLAAAGVNVQRAMRLAGHSDPRTHMRYVGSTPEMRAVPEAALPRVPPPPGSAAVSPPRVVEVGSRVRVLAARAELYEAILEPGDVYAVRGLSGAYAACVDPGGGRVSLPVSHLELAPPAAPPPS